MSEVAARDRIEPHVWRIAPVVILGAIMSILDTMIVNVALETLGARTPLDAGQHPVGPHRLHALARRGDPDHRPGRAGRFGARNVYMLSLVLFTAGSMLCGLATSVGELTLFRVLQGIGGGMLSPVGQMMMANAAGPQRMGRVMSVVAIPAMLAPIFGPLIGGLIVDNFSWPLIFYVNVPIGIVTLIAAIKILPRGGRSDAGRLDYVGLALMSTGLPLLVYGLAEIGTTGKFLTPTVVLPLIASVVLIVSFIFHALRVTNPLLDLHLYRRATFAAASACMFLLGGALFGGLILLPLYWQQIRGESVAYTGLLTAPMGIGMVLVMPLAGRLTDRFGGGLAGGDRRDRDDALATVPFALIGADSSIAGLSAAAVVRGVGVGLAFIPAMTAAYASLKRSELPDAAPQLNITNASAARSESPCWRSYLQRALAVAHTPAESAAAFGTAFWWTLGFTAIAVVPAYLLMRAERAAKREELGERAGRWPRGVGGMTTVAAEPTSARDEAIARLGVSFKHAMAAVRKLRGRDTHRPGSPSLAQCQLLFVLTDHDGLSSGELALAAELSPASVSQLLDPLVDLGLVTRDRSSADRRIVTCSLTDAGRQVVVERRAAFEGRWAAALDN